MQPTAPVQSPIMATRIHSRIVNPGAAAILVTATIASVGCDETTPATPTPRIDAVPVRSAASTGRPAAQTPTATATAAAGLEASASASAPATAAAPLQLRAARKLRAGERASAERTFSKYARLDFAQSFVVEFAGLGTCSFVTQTTETSTRARLAAGDAAAATPPAPSAAATATASAATTATTTVRAEDERAVPSFHLICQDKLAYDFPHFGYAEASWTFQDVDAVAFSDIDADGDTDVIVIASYMTGIGPEGAKPFPVVILFRNEGSSSFSLLTDLSNELTKAGASNVAEVMALLAKQAR
jgi:hypothetical protein